MDFKSSPLGGLYASLRQDATSKAGQDLDQCELRAHSKNAKDLRVKTGPRSGWSSKARRAHQSDAIHVVRDYFHRSVSVLIAERTGLTDPQKSRIRDAGSLAWQQETKADDHYLKLGMLRSLHQRAVAVVDANVPRQPPPAPSFTSSSSSSTPAGVQPTQIAMPLGSPASVRVHPSPSPAGTQAAAAAALKAQYPLSRFPSEHGENDAASSQMRQSAFHRKLEVLVEIAAKHQLRAITPAAEAGGLKALLAAAAAMKLNPGMHPAAALHQQLTGSEKTKIYNAYPEQVDAHISRYTQMSADERAAMRKQVGK